MKKEMIPDIRCGGVEADEKQDGVSVSNGLKLIGCFFCLFR